MTTPLNNQDDLKRRLRFLGSNLDQWDLEDILEAAHRRTIAKVGETIEERLRPNSDAQEEGTTKFQLSFGAVEEVRVIEELDEEVAAINYTVDEAEGTIDFDDTWASDNLEDKLTRVVVEYVPTIFKDIELAYAIEEVLSLTVVQTNDESENARLERWRERINGMVADVNRRASMMADRERGKSRDMNRRRSELDR